MSKIVSIIPARGGSKGVPHKNIKKLAGFPLIAYSIAASELTDQIEQTYVSTDCSQTKEIAESFGATVIDRPEELAQDNSLDIDFMQHFVEYLDGQTHRNPMPELIVHLRPTTPLRQIPVIEMAIKTMIKSPEATSLRSVEQLPESPHKYFRMEGIYLEGLFPKFSKVDKEYYNLPRQHFPNIYNPNGYIDIVRPDTIKTGVLHGNRIRGFETDHVAEIDTTDDFILAETYIKRFMNNETPYSIWEFLAEYF